MGGGGEKQGGKTKGGVLLLPLFCFFFFCSVCESTPRKKKTLFGRDQETVLFFFNLDNDGESRETGNDKDEMDSVLSLLLSLSGRGLSAAAGASSLRRGLPEGGPGPGVPVVEGSEGLERERRRRGGGGRGAKKRRRGRRFGCLGRRERCRRRPALALPFFSFPFPLQPWHRLEGPLDSGVDPLYPLASLPEEPEGSGIEGLPVGARGGGCGRCNRAALESRRRSAKRGGPTGGRPPRRHIRSERRLDTKRRCRRHIFGGYTGRGSG